MYNFLWDCPSSLYMTNWTRRDREGRRREARLGRRTGGGHKAGRPSCTSTTYGSPHSENTIYLVSRRTTGGMEAEHTISHSCRGRRIILTIICWVRKPSKSGFKYNLQCFKPLVISNNNVLDSFEIHPWTFHHNAFRTRTAAEVGLTSEGFLHWQECTSHCAGRQ